MSGNLTHSTANIIQRLLVNLGLGVRASVGGTWPIGFAREQNSPDNAITVFDTAGKDNGSNMITGERSEHLGIMIKVRATKHSIGWTKAQTIATQLDTVTTNRLVTISGTDYTVYSVRRTTQVLSLGKEEPDNRRNIFSVNATVSLRQN
jgi:hypothetical protein